MLIKRTGNLIDCMDMCQPFQVCAYGPIFYTGCDGVECFVCVSDTFANLFHVHYTCTRLNGERRFNVPMLWLQAKPIAMPCAANSSALESPYLDHTLTRRCYASQVET